MENSRTKNSIRNVASGMVYRVIGLIMPFIIRTIIIRKLGIDYVGLNSLFTSVLQVLSLSELGFTSAVVFSLYKPIAEGNGEVICALLKYLRKVYTVIGLVILVVGSALTPAIPYLIRGDYPADINIYLLYFIYLINTVISYLLFAYKGALLTAHQRSDVENNLYSIVFMGLYIIQIVVLLLFANYYVYIIFLPVSTVVMNIVRAAVCKKMYPQYVCRGVISPDTKRAISKEIKAIIGHKISWVVVASTDSIFISSFLGLEVLGFYSNYYMIVSALLGIIGVFYSAITASIGNSIATETVDKNYNDFKKLTYVNVWIMGWMAICLICLYQHFMTIWVGESSLLPFLPTVVLFVVYLYSWRFKDMLCVYKDAAGMWEVDFWKPYVVSLCNIILDFILVQFWGVNGVLIATIISVPVISMPWETHVFFKKYFKRSSAGYYLRMLIYTLILIAIGGITFCACWFLPSSGLWWFVLKAAICLVLPNALVVLVSFRTPEFKYLVGKVKTLFRRNKKRDVQED